MVATRSGSRYNGQRVIDTNRDVNGTLNDHSIVGSDAFCERLGRGCRVPRPTPPSYDTMYVSKVLLPKRRPLQVADDFHINTRYPERDAARRAVLRMNKTLNSLNEESTRSSLRDEGSDDDAESAVDGVSDCGKKASHAKRSVVYGRGVSQYKRERESSIDSSISIESLRDASRGQDRDDDIFARHSSSDDSAPEFMSDSEVRRATKKARECAARNIPINHYLKDVVNDSKESAEKRRAVRRQRRIENAFLGFSEKHDADYGANDPQHHRHPVVESTAPPGDITPLCLDRSVTFEKVGGLPEHIVMLREMVLFPLLYPGMLQAVNLSPPRGVLFVGPPGTGKTLMARALANEGMRYTHRKITFFMRKGADILSKWVGESERQLTMLFEEAKRQQPSIIFFDELDGLVPVRHAKSEQSQAALVATLLALIDGLDDRGQVVVIGATNRPDTIDPALRRPGRFDRELHFPLPDAAARRHILDIVTRPVLQVDHPDREDILQELTMQCAGWSGAELQAVCTEAGLNRLRTAVPQIYVTSRKLQIPLDALAVQKEDFFIAMHRVRHSVRRGVASSAPGVEEHLRYLLQSTERKMLSSVAAEWPSASAALARERRDCSDAAIAILELSSFPIPHVARPLLLSLSASPCGGATSREESEFAVKKAALALVKALPSIRTFALHLQHLAVDCNSSMAAAHALLPQGGDPSETSPVSHSSCFDSGHIYSAIAAVRQSSGPSLLILYGLDSWLEEHGLTSNYCGPMEGEEYAERQGSMKALRYYLNLLCDTDVLIITPTLKGDAGTHFLGDNQLNRQLRAITCDIPHGPSDEDLELLLGYVFRVVDLALKKCVASEWQELPDDESPPSPPTREQVREAQKTAVELWRRVEYRRRQLRYVLAKWLNQYISFKRFSIFLSENLDLAPGHSRYEAWRQHTRGRRMSLCTIMERLENGEYNCVSQYHDDVETLVHNIRTFFQTRSAADRRYRTRALELKEMTVLNLYKINRNVVSFCEEHKNLQEPDIFSSEESEGEIESKSVSTGGAVRKEEPAKKVRKTRFYCGRRKKRRRAVRHPVGKTEMTVSEEKPHDAEVEEKKVIEDKRVVYLLSDEEEEGREEEKEGGNDGAEGMALVEMVPIVKTEASEEKGVEAAVANGGDGLTPGEGAGHSPSQVATEALLHGEGGVDIELNRQGPQEGTQAEEIKAAVQLLRGLSFLRLHLIVQTAMRLLAAEVERRGRGNKVAHSEGCEASAVPFHNEGTESSVLFFRRLVRESIQRTEQFLSETR
ncbi:AAA domain [Trypanosoma vivax]|nr:AAA domain [Trypanosoma vivax]